MFTLRCPDCGGELIRNEIFIRCPTCNIIDFTEQGEAHFEKLAHYCRKNNVSALQIMDVLKGTGN